MEINSLLKALGDPTRYKILLLLSEQKRCVRSLSRALGISEPAVSQHLRIMRTAGLLHSEKYGHHTHYFPDSASLEFLADNFSHLLDKSRTLGSAPGVCHCDMKKEDKK